MSSTGITEVVILPLKPGSDVHDPTSPVGKINQECLNTVLGVDGCQRAFWGTELENPATLRWLVDWDSVDAHRAFMGAPAYAPFLKNLKSILSGPPSVYHAPITPHPATHCLSRSPITEIVNFYVSPTSDTSKGTQDIDKFMGIMADLPLNKKEGAFYGTAGGWTVEGEEVKNEKTGEMCRVYVSLTGWGSVEDHERSSGSGEIKDAMPLLMGLDGLKNITAVHVKMIEAIATDGAHAGGSAPGSAQEEVLNPHKSL